MNCAPLKKRMGASYAHPEIDVFGLCAILAVFGPPRRPSMDCDFCVFCVFSSILKKYVPPRCTSLLTPTIIPYLYMICTSLIN